MLNSTDQATKPALRRTKKRRFGSTRSARTVLCFKSALA